MSRLEQGRIVWAEVLAPDGTRKCRPAVIITASAEISSTEPFVVAAATTSFGEPLPSGYVKLPWHPKGQVRTKLRKPTAVVCHWLVEITANDVKSVAGVVPPEEMLESMSGVHGRDI